MHGEPDSHPASRLARARASLDGLAVGDALGEMLASQCRSARRVIEGGWLPPGPWWHTDDTEMALAIVDELAANGRIVQDSLATRFAQRFEADPERGYGKGTRMQLREMLAGGNWRDLSAAAFGGRGSMGNGAAMRAAPLGAYFADDPALAASEGARSAEVTHAHPEGVAGGIAVAVAAAAAWRGHPLAAEQARAGFWQAVLDLTPAGATRDGVFKASCLPPEMDADLAARLLGSGFLVTSPDTVPFALWCAARHLDDYREALIATLEGDGDCDTNGAIIGGILAARLTSEGVPADWLRAKEPLPLSRSA